MQQMEVEATVGEKWAEQKRIEHERELRDMLEGVLSCTGITSEDRSELNKVLSLFLERCKGIHQPCAICGGQIARADLLTHHIIPREVQKNDSESNLIEVCQGCHKLIHYLYKNRALRLCFEGSLSFFQDCVDTMRGQRKEEQNASH